jgi:hypothetical protein
MKVRCGFLCFTRSIFDDFINRVILRKVTTNPEFAKSMKNLNNEILLINSFWGLD